MIKRPCVEILGTCYPASLLRSSETTFEVTSLVGTTLHPAYDSWKPTQLKKSNFRWARQLTWTMDQYSYLLTLAFEGNIQYHGRELGEELGWFLASRKPSGRLPHIWPAQLPNQPEEASNKHRVDQKIRMGPLTLPATRIRCM